jgi:MFS family permease
MDDPRPSTRPPASASYRWWVVGMLWLVCFFNYADRQAMAAVFPVLKAEFGFTSVELGAIGSAFMWVYAGGALVAGWICDRARRRDVILGGCLLWSLVTAMTGWCGTLWQFITVRAVEGLAETFYFPASMSLLSDYHGPRTRSRALAFHQSSVYIGTIGGSWLGAWLAVAWDWRAGFWIFGGLGVVLAVILSRFLREPQRGAGSSAVAAGAAAPGAGGTQPPDETQLPFAEAVRLILRTPVAPLLMLAFLCANFVATIFLTWTPTFLVEKFQMPLADAGLYGSASICVASAIGAPLAGWLADLLAARHAGGRLMIQAAGLVVGAAFVTGVGTATTAAALFARMGAFGLCKGCYDAGIFAGLFDHVEPRARGTATGLMNTVGWGGGALGPLAVGLAARYGGGASEAANMSTAIAWCGGVYLLAAALFVAAILWQRRHTR